MSAAKRPKEHLTGPEIEQRLKNAEDKSQYRKWLAVWLSFSQKIARREIAILVGVSLCSIKNWLVAYDKYGPDGLKSRKHLRGRKSFLGAEKEAEILEELKAKAEAGELVTAVVIRNIFVEQLGHKLAAGYVYNVLERHNWRKIKPRPVHPKGNKEQQEELKKTLATTYYKPPLSFTKTTKDQSE